MESVSEKFPILGSTAEIFLALAHSEYHSFMFRMYPELNTFHQDIIAVSLEIIALEEKK